MDAEILLAALVRLQLVASAAILVVFLLRPLALRWCGASIAYWLWLVVPLAAMAALLPAREQVVVLPTAFDIPILQEHVEPAVVAGVARERTAAPSAIPPGVPYDRLGSGLLIALWLLGAGVFLIRSIVNTRRLASSPLIGPALVGVLRPRLVLPKDFETRFDAEERALILAHEEIHRVSRHTMVNALVEVARCASWFNPLVHWAAARFRADQELACDTAVIAAHPEARRTYAEALLKAQVAGVHLPMGCVWTSGTAGRLAERIARLSEQLPGRRQRFVGAASIVGIGMVAGYAAWAQQPARIIDVQQPNPESAAAMPADIPELEAREAVAAPVSQAPVLPDLLSSALLTKSPAAEFASESVDEEWSSRKRNELIDSLTVLEGMVSTAQIDCRSSSCRVELKWPDPATAESEDQQRQRNQRIGMWAGEVMKGSGFLRGDTDFGANRPTSLSYFTMKPLSRRAELPPGLSPEAAESSRRSMRDEAGQLRQTSEAGAVTSAGNLTFTPATQ